MTNWEHHEFTEKAAICFILNKEEILLIRKLKGLGAGKMNGPGGRLEPGETEMQAAIRETEEEVGLTPLHLKKAAELSFIFTSGYSLFCSVFLATGFSGTLKTTDEAIPCWFPQNKIPYDEMWEDDRIWLPAILSGKLIKACFVFDDDRMLSSEISDVTDFPLC